MIQLWTCHNSRHFDWSGAAKWKIYQWSSENFKAWWNRIYSIVTSWVVYMIQCGLVTTQDILIATVPQIGKSTNGVRETSKLGGTRLLQVF
jgi:hypothetical protein